MPKFLYSVVVFLIMIWGSFVFMLLKTPPSNYFNIVLFLVILCLVLGFSSSFVVFMFKKDEDYNEKELRVQFRTYLRWCLYASFVISGFLLLKALDLLNVLILGIFMVFCTLLFLKLRKN